MKISNLTALCFTLYFSNISFAETSSTANQLPVIALPEEASKTLAEPTVTADAHAVDRIQMRALLAESVRGINEQNLDLFTKHIDDSAKVTWLNNEVTQGPQGVKDYFTRMVGKSEGAVLDRYMTEPSKIEPARFYGDNVAIANGEMVDKFTPHHRSDFTFNSRWTATLVKNGTEWKIVSLNLSTNTFNNVLISKLEQRIIYAGLAGLLGGILLMFLINRFRSSKNTRNI